MQFHSYLLFDGDCREAFTFYADVLGGTIEFMQSHGDSPIADDVAPAWRDRILHASLAVGDALLMASDAPPERYERPQGLSVSIQCDDAAEAERVYAALAAGGEETMPLAETFWAERFGMVVDRYGIPWMVNYAGGAGETAT